MKTLYQCGSVLVMCLMMLVFSAGGASAGVVDSKGTEFILAFMQDNGRNGDLSVYISSDVGAQGVVEISRLNFTRSFNIAADELAKIDIPSYVQLRGGLGNLGIHVSSDNEISVYGLDFYPNTTDAFMVLPVDALGIEYIPVSYPAWSRASPSEMAIVGVYDNTEVTITPSVPVEGGYHEAYSAGIPFTITLNRYDTYLLTGMNKLDVTGSIIKASAPISVIAGSECTFVPVDVAACDYLAEMMPPVSTWGKSFLTVPLATRLKGDLFRIIASQDDTIVRINGTDVAVLGRGKFYETILMTASEIETSKPALVAQYSVGQNYDGVISDPFMMLVPPTEQFLDSYTFASMGEFAGNYVNVVTPSEYISSIVLDGSVVDQDLFSPIGASGFSGAQIPIETGSHSISGSMPFGIYVYGFGWYDSYGYPGGMSFDLINSQGDQYEPNLKLVQNTDAIYGIAEDSEDLNINGILESDEDLNGNGIIDRRTEDLNNNGILDPGEDTNNDGLLDSDSGIYKIELETGSENLQIQLQDFVPGSTRAEFTITRVDTAIPGEGVLIVSDGVGNTITRQISIADKKSLHNVRLVSTLSSDRLDLDSSSFSVPPASVTSNNGETVIEWQFDHVYVDQIENLQYDVVLHDPQHGEIRVVTQKLDLYYIDVNGNEVHSGLGETIVSVLPSIIQIDVATDKSTYTANELVNIDAAYKNLSDFENPLNVRISIRDSQGAMVATLLEQGNVAVAPGGTWKPANLTYATGNLYEGLYEVRAELLDDNGVATIYDTAQFIIVPSSDITVSAKLSTDKYLYDPFEAATLHDHVINTTTNAVLDGMTVLTTVYTPDSTVFWTQTDSLPQVLPGSTFDLNYPVPLARAVPGEYRALMVISDSQNVERAIAETRFEVRSSADTGVGLSGEITSIPSDGHVLRTEDLHLTANVENLGNAGIDNLPISLALIDPANQQVVAQWDEVIGSLAMQSSHTLDEDWRAMAPVGSTYIAVLTATIGDQQKVLTSKSVTVGEKIKSAFTRGSRGRLLVLLDEEPKCQGDKHKDGKDRNIKHDDKGRCDERHDVHGDKNEPSLAEQRAFLEARLKENGWSYTIVTNGDDFSSEMRSNGYVAYALFSENEKLNEQVQHELQERIYRGEGLLMAGSHDERNGRLDSALGIRVKGKYTKVDSFTFLESPLNLTGGQDLPYSENAIRIEPDGAEVAATFDFEDFGHKRDKHILETGVQTCDQGKGKPKDSNAAVTTYQFGLGHSVYAAFDLLAQATATQNENLLNDLLVAGLTYSHPQNLGTVQTSVIPINLMLTNVGTEIGGRALITLPEGVQIIDPGVAVMDTDGKIVWTYDLDTDESDGLDFWVHIPDVTTDLTFNALIQIGQEPDWEDYGATELVVRPGVYPGLYDAINELSSLLNRDRNYRFALRELQHADRSLQRNRVADAIKHMLMATDALSKARHERADDIRVMVDNAITVYAQQLSVNVPYPDHGRHH